MQELRLTGCGSAAEEKRIIERRKCEGRLLAQLPGAGPARFGVAGYDAGGTGGLRRPLTRTDQRKTGPCCRPRLIN